MQRLGNVDPDSINQLAEPDETRRILLSWKTDLSPLKPGSAVKEICAVA